MRGFDQRRIIVTCGTGGVGKTTLSAALAVRAALLGKKALVVTIDPAKRLANALGLDQPGSQKLDLSKSLEKTYSHFLKYSNSTLSYQFPERAGGELHALSPDTLQTFETLLTQLTSNTDQIEKIKKNPIFKIFTREFSGSNEYMAMELVYQLFHEKQGSNDRYDLIVLDTPPSTNTLEFFDAPHLLTRLFNENLLRWLVVPVNKLVSTGIRKALGLLESLTGSGFMTQIMEFASSLYEVQPRFSANLKRIIDLLASPEVGFMMVTVPFHKRMKETEIFIREVNKRNFHFDGILLNRSLAHLPIQGREEKSVNKAALELAMSMQNVEEEITSNPLFRDINGWIRIPELARDPHSLSDLIVIANVIQKGVTH